MLLKLHPNAPKVLHYQKKTTRKPYKFKVFWWHSTIPTLFRVCFHSYFPCFLVSLSAVFTLNFSGIVICGRSVYFSCITVSHVSQVHCFVNNASDQYYSSLFPVTILMLPHQGMGFYNKGPCLNL